MVSYRFLNKDHSLVWRDDHVIKWDEKTNAPATDQVKQIVGTGKDDPPVALDEVQIWKDAGSPMPLSYDNGNGGVRPVPVGMPIFPKMPDLSEVQQVAASPTQQRLDVIGKDLERPLGEVSLTALTKQVQMLTEAVKLLLKDRKK